jgi:hypothetical protein
MDNIKDSSKIDTKNQLSSLSVVSIYGLENSDDSIKDKVERLSAVVYLATNHIKDIDPIKLSVREVCLNCLKTVNDTPSFIGQTNLSPQFSEILISDLNKIVSFLRVLSISGFISKNNFEVISGAVSVILEKSFMKEEIFIGKKEDQIGEKNAPESTKTFPQKIEKTSFQNTNSKDKGGRGERVLSLIRKQGKVATKDIVDYFPGVSDKTIQRELNKLVDEGKIERQGKKRWSFYSIA